MSTNKNEYESAVEVFDCMNEILLTNEKTATIEEVIQLLNYNESFKRILTIIFNQNKDRLYSGDFNIFENNHFLNDVLAINCIISAFNKKNDIDIPSSENNIRNLLSWDEENYLTDELLSGDEFAKRRLIEVNSRYITPIAYRYLPFANGYSLGDLIVEGEDALIKASNDFNKNKGDSFSKYAKRCINNALYNYTVAHSKLLPGIVEKYARYDMKCVQKKGRKPTIKDIFNIINSQNIELIKVSDDLTFEALDMNESKEEGTMTF